MFAFLLLGGCGRSGPVPRTPDAAAMFAPVSIRVHPIFSGIKDWTGDDKPDGIEANLEFEDQFADPTKAAGTIVFELFAYRQYEPDPRGERLVNPWVGSLRTLDEQQARWNRTSRTYQFQLEYPAVRPDRDYVLSATFDAGGTRFFDRVILQAPPKVRAAPATRPAAPAIGAVAPIAPTGNAARSGTTRLPLGSDVTAPTPAPAIPAAATQPVPTNAARP